jgi:hypothetical protein
LARPRGARGAAEAGRAGGRVDSALGLGWGRARESGRQVVGWGDQD